MPDREVQTIKDLIYYQYAKIIARRAFSASDGKTAKNLHYGFIKKTFHETDICRNMGSAPITSSHGPKCKVISNVYSLANTSFLERIFWSLVFKKIY